MSNCFANADAHEMTDRGLDELKDPAADPPIIVSEPPMECAKEGGAESEAEAEVSVSTI